MLQTLRFSLQNAVYFIMLPFFGSCVIHILHTGCAKIYIYNSGAKRLKFTRLFRVNLRRLHFLVETVPFDRGKSCCKFIVEES
jgi:hypothetical protein